MSKGQEFINEMPMFLGFDVWHYGNKYVIAGNEYTLGECVSDILNFDFGLIETAYQEMDLVLQHTPSKQVPNTGLITVTQSFANKMLDVLLAIKPYSELPGNRLSLYNTLTGLYGERLANPNTQFTRMDKEILKAFYMRFYMIRTDLLRARLIFTDLLDNYVFEHDASPDATTIAKAYEHQLDDIYDPQKPKRYTDVSGKTYLGSDIIKLTNPTVIDFGIPPPGSTAPGICEIITFTSLFDFTHWEICKALMAGIVVKRCKYCGRFFTLDRGYAYEYCANIAPGETERICRQVGALKSHENKIKNDPVWAVYRKAYKKYHGRVGKKTMSQSDFLTWAENAKTLRDRALSGDMTVEELGEALNNL